MSARISAVSSSVIFWQPITATTSCTPALMLIHAVRMAALPDAHAASVSHVGFGVSPRYFLHDARQRALLVVLGHRAHHHRVHLARFEPGVGERGAERLGRQLPCTVASLRRPNGVPDADDADAAAAHRYCPPSTCTTWPVTWRAASEH